MESQVVSSADFVPSKDGTQSDELVSNGTTDTQYDEGVSCNNMRCSEKSEQALSSSDITNNNKESECISTEFLKEKYGGELEPSSNSKVSGHCDLDQNKGEQNIDCSKNEDTCSSLSDASKTNSSNCPRNQDYRLNLTGIEGAILEAVPEDSAVPQLPISDNCPIDKKEENLCQVMEPYKPNDNHTTEPNTINTNLQDIPFEPPQMTTSQSESKKDRPPTATQHIPESNASDVSECSILTSATAISQRDKYLSQIMTKTEALTARQQVALWLTRTSMSDLSSMPSLKNIVYPPSAANKEPPSKSSQSSHCSCYHHAHDKHYTRKSIGSNCNSRPLSTAMSECCFDDRGSSKQTIDCSHSHMSPKQVKAGNLNPSETSKNANIRRNYSTKSLIGGFSFGFRVGSSKSFNDNKREKNTCEEKQSLMPSPIGFRKCETVVTLSGANVGSPSGTKGVIDESGAYSNIATSTIIKRRYHNCRHSTSSHSCSVNNVRQHCGQGNTSPSVEKTSHCSKRSLSLFKKLSSSKERSCNRLKMHNNPMYNHTQQSSRQSNNSSFYDVANYYGAPNNSTNACESPHPGITPINRHRSNASIACSRCTSAFSVNASRMTSRAPSQMSLLQMASCRKLSTAGSSLVGYNVAGNNTSSFCDDLKDVPEVLCKICLVDYPSRDMFKLHECSCSFCRECMVRYVTMEVTEGAYEISCPDSECEKQEGRLQMSEIEILVGSDLLEKHKTFRLDTEVALDANRAWCPQVGCNTICHICTSENKNINQKKVEAVPVQCPTCDKEFCSLCSANWHPGLTCAQNGNALFTSASNAKRTNSNVGLIKAASVSHGRIMGPAGEFLPVTGGSIEGDIKRCPMCNVPIERDAGCAQMMCKRCKHVFCWFCLTSLDEDFLLRHYDSGECKGLLGHTRASVLWHRAQVIGIFAGFGILLLIASPLLLMAAPCIFCCNCKTCQKTEVDTEDQEGGLNNLKKGESVIKDDNGVFGRFSSGFRIGGAVRKDSEDMASVNSPVHHSASARFSTAGTPPPSFTADPYKEQLP